jgi:hypothetical protein
LLEVSWVGTDAAAATLDADAGAAGAVEAAGFQLVAENRDGGIADPRAAMIFPIAACLAATLAAVRAMAIADIIAAWRLSDDSGPPLKVMRWDGTACGRGGRSGSRVTGGSHMQHAVCTNTVFYIQHTTAEVSWPPACGKEGKLKEELGFWTTWSSW